VVEVDPAEHKPSDVISRGEFSRYPQQILSLEHSMYYPAFPQVGTVSRAVLKTQCSFEAKEFLKEKFGAPFTVALVSVKIALWGNLSYLVYVKDA